LGVRTSLATIIFVLSLACFLIYVAKPPVSGLVYGYSMYPTIQAGDIVYGYPPKLPSDIKVGDIIAFKYETENQENLVIVHRVIDILPDGTYVCRGDNAPPDEIQYVYFYDVVCVVDEVAKQRTLKYYMYTCGHLIGIFGLLVASVLLISSKNEN